MDPTALASLLRDYGPWGLLACSLIVNRWLFGKYDGAMQGLIEAGKLQTPVLQACTKALDEVTKLGATQVARFDILIDRLDREGR